jgi:carboxymethylenebutenolidase
MLHGRAGPYSSLAHGVYTAATLTHRHQNWGQLWASRGYFALMVDSFGPRGYPAGFAAGTYDSRPLEINEVTVRPLDAYGGLRYLRSRSDIDGDRIGLQGWSNGGSTVLATMAEGASGGLDGFRAALALYPGCLLQHRYEAGYRPYAPVRIFIGTADEEVSPKICMNFADKATALGSDVMLTIYPDATHDFDDPGKKFQRLAANREAADDTRARAVAFFAAELGR